MRRLWLGLIAATALGWVAPVPASALAYHLTFGGVVDSVDDRGALAASGVEFLVGDRFSFDVMGAGDGAWTGTVDVGDDTFDTLYGSDMKDDAPIIGDELVLGASDPFLVPGTSLTIDFLSARLLDSSGTALDGPDFPESLDIADWNGRFFLMRGSVPNGDDFEVLGTLDAASVQTTPEPGTALLLGFGLVVLATRRRPGS